MSSARDRHRPLRGLIADDDPVIRKHLVKRFTDAGIVVTACPDGEHALSSLQERQFDFVVIDLRMPGKSGLDVLGHLSGSRNAKTPVIVLTAIPEQCDDALQLGARRCLLKTETTPEEVVAAVVAACAD